MKQQFSIKWKSSRQPRKQRKYRYNAPLHIRHKFMSALLSKQLRQSHGMRNIEVRKGDEVKVMRGKFKKKQGKIADVDIANTRVAIENIQRSKRDGSKVNVWFNPSNLMIISLNTDDKKRLKHKKKLKEENKLIVLKKRKN